MGKAQPVFREWRPRGGGSGSPLCSTDRQGGGCLSVFVRGGTGEEVGPAGFVTGPRREEDCAPDP